MTATHRPVTVDHGPCLACLVCGVLKGVLPELQASFLELSVGDACGSCNASETEEHMFLTALRVHTLAGACASVEHLVGSAEPASPLVKVHTTLNEIYSVARVPVGGQVLRSQVQNVCHVL